jgi:hypothetical protein
MRDNAVDHLAQMACIPGASIGARSLNRWGAVPFQKVSELPMIVGNGFNGVGH